MKNVITILCFVSSCIESDPCYNTYTGNATSYEFNPTSTSQNGISVDQSGYEVDLDYLDDLTDALELCLRDDLSDPEFKIKHECLNVKIAPNWVIHPDTKNDQVFECDIPGHEYCYGVVQDGNIIVVTPDLAAYPHETMHVVLGVADPIPKNLINCKVLDIRNEYAD